MPTRSNMRTFSERGTSLRGAEATLRVPLTLPPPRRVRESFPFLEEMVTSWPTILSAEASLRPGSPVKTTFSPLALKRSQEGLTSALLAEHFSTTPTVVERAGRDPGHRPPGRQR